MKTYIVEFRSSPSSNLTIKAEEMKSDNPVTVSFLTNGECVALMPLDRVEAVYDEDVGTYD
ncbi:MAG: hypothetical protein OXL36_06675 [Bryobacterales bacterium]|nr:hypothetical protein [Bryobacterales bacterium]MDE0296617.1 hypothetical protein [Bryobacterales bacterium]